METTFSMTRVQHIMRRDLIENWKSNLYGLLGILLPAFSRCWAFYGRQNAGRKKVILKSILLSDFAAICWG